MLPDLTTPVQGNEKGFHIQNLDLQTLARTYGTPLYIYDLDFILARYRQLAEAIAWPRTRIFYAMKANGNLDILRALREAGACIDAVSPAEVLLALKAGFDKKRILYTANNLTADEMHVVHGLGVLLNIDALSCLDKYGQAYPGSEVCLRFNSDVVAGDNAIVQTGGDKTKFGILLEEAAAASSLAARHNLKIVGLHEHTGSGIAEAESFYQGMRNLLAIATRDAFPDLRFIDFGGGFKVAYRPGENLGRYESFGQQAAAIFADFCRVYGRELDLYFEPGKYLVAESGVLLMQVNTLKANRGRLMAGTDSGFGHLIRPLLYNAYHHILNLSNPLGAAKIYDICGNICETGDLFAADRSMPEIREGDYLAVLNAGAYCYAMASLYNLRPLPAEIVIRDGAAALSRPALSHAALAEAVYAAHRPHNAAAV